jgi:hypothetical protein
METNQKGGKKMSTIRKIFFGFALLAVYVANGQETTYYNFVNTMQEGALNFKYKRECVGDSIYKEAGLFSRDTTKVYTFKKTQGVWKIKINNRWMPFFDGCTQVKTQIVVNGYVYKIQWQKTAFMDNDLLIYKLKLVPVGFSVSGNPTYFFTYKDGIIAIDGHDAFLVRSDKKDIKVQ